MRSATGVLRKLTHPTQVALGNLRATIEEWEANYREYRDRTGKDLDDDQKSLNVQDMCPDSLRHHLEVQASRLNTYALIPQKLLRISTLRAACEAGGAMPMGVSSIKLVASNSSTPAKVTNRASIVQSL